MKIWLTVHSWAYEHDQRVPPVPGTGLRYGFMERTRLKTKWRRCNKVATTRPLLLLGLALLFFPFCEGCANVEMAYHSGFLKDYARMVPQHDMDKVWIAPGADFSRYNTLIIPPINESYLRITDLDAIERKKVIDELVKNFRAEMIHHFSTVTHDPSKINENEPALRLDLILAELKGTDVMMNVMIGYGMGNATGTIEGRFIDTRTGEELVSFADRKKGSGFTKREWQSEAKSWISADYKKLKYLFLFAETWAENVGNIVEALKK